MYSANVTVKNKTGLHARPASMFVKTANGFKSNITIKKGEKVAPCRSIINLIALGIGCDTEVTITAEGEDEVLAVNTLVELINSKFGEN